MTDTPVAPHPVFSGHLFRRLADARNGRPSLVDGHETDDVGVYGSAGPRSQQGGTGMARPDASGRGSAQADAWAEGRQAASTGLDGAFRIAGTSAYVSKTLSDNGSMTQP